MDRLLSPIIVRLGSSDRCRTRTSPAATDGAAGETALDRDRRFRRDPSLQTDPGGVSEHGVDPPAGSRRGDARGGPQPRSRVCPAGGTRHGIHPTSDRPLMSLRRLPSCASANEMRSDGIRPFRQHRAGGLSARARLYELRRSEARHPPLDPGRGEQQSADPSGSRGGDQLLRYSKRVLRR